MLPPPGRGDPEGADPPSLYTIDAQPPLYRFNPAGQKQGFLQRPDPEDPEAPRATAQQDPWHYSIARMVDACTSAGILPFYGPYGDIKDVLGCETQFRAAFLLGCVGAWSLHPAQIAIAKKVFFSPPATSRLRQERPRGHPGRRAASRSSTARCRTTPPGSNAR